MYNILIMNELKNYFFSYLRSQMEFCFSKQLKNIPQKIFFYDCFITLPNKHLSISIPRRSGL